MHSGICGYNSHLGTPPKTIFCDCGVPSETGGGGELEIKEGDGRQCWSRAEQSRGGEPGAGPASNDHSSWFWYTTTTCLNPTHLSYFLLFSYFFLLFSRSFSLLFSSAAVGRLHRPHLPITFMCCHLHWWLSGPFILCLFFFLPPSRQCLFGDSASGTQWLLSEPLPFSWYLFWNTVVAKSPWLALSWNGTFPHVFMARIKHYYIISYNAVYHALIGGIKDSCSFSRLAFGFKTRSTSAFGAAGLLKLQPCCRHRRS